MLNNTDTAARLTLSALCDADHLASCAEHLLATLNKVAVATESCESAEDPTQREAAEAAREAAEEQYAEYWAAVRSAAYEYRKRAQRARAVLTAPRPGPSTNLNLDVIRKAYGWTISTDGELHGLTSGDMGYEATGIRLVGETLQIWETGVSHWTAAPLASNDPEN